MHKTSVSSGKLDTGSRPVRLLSNTGACLQVVHNEADMAKSLRLSVAVMDLIVGRLWKLNKQLLLSCTNMFKRDVATLKSGSFSVPWFQVSSRH